MKNLNPLIKSQLIILSSIISTLLIITTGCDDTKSTTLQKPISSTTTSASIATTTPQAISSPIPSISSTNTVNSNKLNFQKVRVSRVVDGDTIETSDGKKIRLIGINTPESTTKTEQYGKEASNYTKSQLEGKEVYLEKDVSETDKYGRLLRYVWLQQPETINEESIRKHMYNANLCLNGFAQVSTYPPDVKYAEHLTKFTAEARNSNKGLWAINSNGTTKGDNQKQTTPTQYTTNKTNSVVPVNSNVKTVYWTPNGKSYHYSSACRTLARSKTILSGTLDESGKYDPCDVCTN